ncbi:hypothetical protein [Hyphomonas sp.]|uniref:hypothetical protein n=1 Tax=Hyphomonas sp. TaxID=87 RepID=UPI0035274B42
MVIRVIMAALAAGGSVGAASAEDIRAGYETKPDVGLLYGIRNTACASGSDILFLPVSHDVPANETSYALVPADNLNVFSAHVVTPDQRIWLIRHGCRSPAARQQALMNVSTVTPDSGGFDY